MRSFPLAIFSGPTVKQEVGFQFLHSQFIGRTVKGSRGDTDAEGITHAAAELLVGLFPASVVPGNHVKKTPHLLELRRIESVCEMVQQPDRSHIFRFNTGPTQRDMMKRAFMVRSGKYG